MGNEASLPLDPDAPKIPHPFEKGVKIQQTNIDFNVSHLSKFPPLRHLFLQLCPRKTKNNTIRWQFDSSYLFKFS